MRASEQEGTGSAATNYVKGDFEQIGWGPVDNLAHDLGTDLFIQVRDERRFARGLVVGAQVKGRPSFFESAEQTEDGVLKGWWFYEANTAHFDDWVRYGFPHLVVLYNYDTKKSYWVHVTAEKCVRTGKGCKILVPVDQTVDSEHLDALLDVATAQRAASAFEQKVFHASAASAPPGHRLRYALLIPRLIAPHGNTGYVRPPEPEEYIALLARCRSHQILGFKSKFPEQLSSEQMKASSDWRWRLAHAFEAWLEDDELDELSDLVDSAPDTAQASALTVVLATAHVQRSAYAEAHELLDHRISKDDASPVDFAWLLVHRATVRAELGDVAGARADAATATKSLRGDEDDPTASLLAGVAANILFVTADFGSGDLEEVINSNDTAPAWWRAQTLSWALGHLDDESFEEWVSDDRLRFNASNEGWEQLEAVRLNAALASDREALHSIASRQGRYLVRRADRNGEQPAIARGLDELRRAGSKDALERAVRVVWSLGPAHVLRPVAERASPSSITRSSAATTLALWSEVADVLTEDYATELLSWCTRLLGDGSVLLSFRQRFGSTFRVDAAALHTMEELLPVASASARAEAARLILAIPTGSPLSQAWSRIVLNLDKEALRAVGLDAIRTKVAENHDFLLKDALLARLAAEGDAEARAALIERAETDVYALAYVPNQADYDEALSRRFIAILAGRLATVREKAAAGSFGIGGLDVARLMTHLNLLHPSAADWETLFAYLLDDNVAAEDKAGAIAQFVIDFDRLDDGARARLRSVLPAVMATTFRYPARPRQQPEAAWRLHVMLQESEVLQQSAVAAFLSGNSSQRRVAAQLLGRGIAPALAPALHALVVDECRAVRTGAASALGRLVGRVSDEHGVWLPAVARVVTDSGGEVPSWFLDGLLAEPFKGDPGVIELVDNLRSHASQQVRQSVEMFLARLLQR